MIADTYNMDNLYHLFLQFPDISTDTRNIKPNSIFFCLKGDIFDGNRFALDALEKGAKYVVTEDISLKRNDHCIIVKDVLLTLHQLAHYHRKKLNIPLIGITGTNGKTTTKELVYRVLSTNFKTAYTKGNLNNHIGVPLTLLDIKSDDEIAIVEMGANHLGEIAMLCKIALPNIGIITNIGNAHLEGFGSIENIIKTKKALFDSVINANGTLFINADEEVLMPYTNYSSKICYSGKGKGTISGEVINMNPYLTIELFSQKIETRMTGYYNLYNILSAATAGCFFNIEKEKIAEAISTYSPDNQRSQLIYRDTTTIIADYYNANPDSMRAALQNLSRIEHSDKIAILGDMFELGNASLDEHRKIVTLTQQLNIDCYFVGEIFERVASSPHRVFSNVDLLNTFLRDKNLQQKLILIKGSRGMHLEKLHLLQDDKS